VKTKTKHSIILFIGFVCLASLISSNSSLIPFVIGTAFASGHKSSGSSGGGSSGGSGSGKSGSSGGSGKSGSSSGGGSSSSSSSKGNHGSSSSSGGGNGESKGNNAGGSSSGGNSDGGSNNAGDSTPDNGVGSASNSNGGTSGGGTPTSPDGGGTPTSPDGGGTPTSPDGGGTPTSPPAAGGEIPAPLPSTNGAVGPEGTGTPPPATTAVPTIPPLTSGGLPSPQTPSSGSTEVQNPDGTHTIIRYYPDKIVEQTFYRSGFQKQIVITSHASCASSGRQTCLRVATNCPAGHQCKIVGDDLVFTYVYPVTKSNLPSAPCPVSFDSSQIKPNGKVIFVASISPPAGGPTQCQPPKQPPTQPSTQPPPKSQCPTASAGTFGLPPNNVKTSDYNAVRVYLKDGSVHTIPTGTDPSGIYPPDQIAMVRTHQGVDYSSRDAKGKVVDEPFTAGVSGTVHIVQPSTTNTINVVLPDGSTVQYLHASQINVVEGQQISPDTELGITGSTGANAVHLHIQAKDPQGHPINPEDVINKFNKKNNPGCQ
jgi:murein DD-endopeptidase MepM/ murein hydrolase activator NlpD